MPKTFRFDATLLNTDTLSQEVLTSFESALQARGAASDLRVSDDEEGRVTVSFRLDAETEREALRMGSDLTRSALDRFTAVRWVAASVAHWRQD